LGSQKLLSEELLLSHELLLGDELLSGGGNHWSSDLSDLVHSSAGDSLAEVVEAGSSPDSGSGHGGGSELLGSDLGGHELLLDGGGGELDGGDDGGGGGVAIT